MIRRSTAFPLFALVALAACSNDSTAPVSTLKPSGPAFSASASADGAGTYLVRFRGSGVPAGFAEAVSAAGGEIVFAHAKAGIAAVAGLDDARAGQLAATSGIAAVDPDAVTTLDDPAGMEVDGFDAPQSPSNPAAAIRFPRQWHHQVINAQGAWAAGKRGSSSVKVGIIDTGIDYLHPDTYGRVDLTLSKSFLSATENARVQTAFPGAHEIADLHYHGTHVASTAVSNALIAAGVTSGATLVGLKVCAPGQAPAWQASCPTSSVLAALLYAADNKINVVNMSLGGTFNRRDGSAKGGFGPSFIATIQQVMNYTNRGGTTVVVSAGNSAIDMDRDQNSFSAYCSAAAVICVSATGPTAAGPISGTTGMYTSLTNVDALAGYSNFGRSAVSVAAPGGNAAPVWAACSGFSLAIPACQARFYNPTTGAFSGFVVGISGTSMASPHVAGVAALIASDGITSPAQIGARIRQSADDLGQPGTDPAYGAGRVNAARAVGAI
jgi:subtilisin family serine protease